eukprot:GHVR01171096.1.p1 GENE.GHVR01171096.1~~GHVR01171096.1.p1  ORF type:complete len:144 (-),score=5.94 GHVR01171096.1:356-787(-)
MYGRQTPSNNIFTRNSNSTSNYNTPSNNYNSSNNYNLSSSNYGNSNNNNNLPYNSNNSYSAGNKQTLGSYRLNYKPEEMSHHLSSMCTQWREMTPMSITSREETLHLSQTELRLEDYFMIRNGQLTSTHERAVKDAFRNGAFN